MSLDTHVVVVYNIVGDFFMSKWSKYHGIAVTSIEKKNQQELYVFCPELIPLSSGSIDETTEPLEINLKNSAGPQKTIKVETADTILATYFGTSATNRSIPDIHAGEQLIIYHYAEGDTYYWVPAGRDDDLRKTEHLRFSVANTQKTLELLDDDNTYYIEFDTKYGNKHILISTSNSDGEDYRYTVKIDAKCNTVDVKDDSGNELFLDSNVPRWHMKNRSGSEIDLNDTNILLKAEGDIVITAGGSITEKAASITEQADTIKEEGSSISSIASGPNTIKGAPLSSN